jgi:O-antigen/teichoic acid export membrane protein
MIENSEQENKRQVPLFNQIRQKGMGAFWRNRKISAIFVLIGANIFNNLVVFLINIVVARKFGPDNFGIFSLAVSVMVAVNLVVDIGINLTIVRFHNLYSDDEERQDVLLLSLLMWKVSVVIALILISVPLGILATRVFGLSQAHTVLFSLSVASAGIFGLWLFFQSYLQARKRFKKLAVYIAFCAFLRLVCFLSIFLWLASSINLQSAFGSIYTVPLLVATSVGLFSVMIFLFKRGAPGVSVIKSNIMEILQYSKWVAIAGLCNSLIYRGVQFILAIQTSRYELGIFSAGFVFTLAFTPLNVAVRTVFFPHVTAYKEKKDMIQHLNRMKAVFPYFVVFVIVSICCLAAIQIIFLGDQYRNALPVFLITSVALSFCIFMGLASMLVHTLMHPEIDAFTNIGRLIVSSLLVYLLAPSLGAIGGAFSYALPLVVGEILMVLYVRRSIYERK